MTLKFGTDGVRGVAGRDLTPELVVALGRAAVRALGADEPFLIARDTRRSGPMLEAALVAGICAEGGSAELLGVLPTPGLAGAYARSGAPGAMISASHNPYPDNGIKFFEAGGRKLRDETETRIESELTALIADGTPPRDGTDIGIVTAGVGAVDAYIEQLVVTVDPGSLRGLTIVLDCGHGAAFAAAPRAFVALGATVEVLNAAPDGININDGCGSTDPSGLITAVRNAGADAGLAFDGDADRVVAVDEQGGIVDGDHILAIAAIDLKVRGRLRHDAIATTVMANLGLRRALDRFSITVVETPVGDRHVLAAMEEHDLVLGGEQSGHVIFGDHAVTGDGPLAGILLLEAKMRAGAPLSEMAGVVTKYPQVLRNVRVRERGGLDAATGFWTEVRAVEGALGDDGRVLVRPSGTEPVVRVMVEASDEAVAQSAADRLTTALEAAWNRVMECVLAIDLGTSGPKVAFVDTAGVVVDTDYEPTELILTDDGGVEQDPDDWWRAITTATRRMVARGTVTPDQVIGICCTAQWLGTVAVDGQGSHLMNAIIWMDARGAEYMPGVTGGTVTVQGYEPRKITRWIRVSGGAPGHSGKDPTAHILWIKHHRPDVYRATATFLEPKDYLNLRLTGRAVASVDSIAGHFVTDNRDLDHVVYDDQLVEFSELDRSTLPELVRAVDVIGGLRTDAAAELGLPAGIDVVAGTPDVQSATLGSGALADFSGHLYLGTSSWITCHVPFKKTDLFANMASLPAAIPNRYFVGNDQETAGACLEWLRANVLWPDDALGTGPAPTDAFARIDALAAGAPVGSGSVIFTPWLNGERTPVDDHTIRASWVNQSLTTTRADQVRAVLEGVAYNSKWLLSAVEKFVDRKLDPLRVIGGGARSDLWCQIHADVLGREIQQVADPQAANVRGAAFLGLVGLGRATFADLAASVAIGTTYPPDPVAAATYAPLAKEFRILYRRTKSIHARLNG